MLLRSVIRNKSLIPTRRPIPSHTALQCRAASTSNATEATTAINLAAYAPKQDIFNQPQRWVCFSDLHVSLKTLPICLQVLQQVHENAAARDAGVLFLGDFWHMRGSLPVEPLNEVINVIQQWKQPSLFLVGNHDQVTLGGLVHSLTPLAAASSSIHVFDGPAYFRNALWLPYRRNETELKEAITAAAASSSGHEIKAIFAHADIVGASMNDVVQAKDGLQPNLFPPNIPIYTGHYHKPHIVPGTSIQYVGSPYQVSRSEAGQEKKLLVLDGGSWAIQESIPLDIGPRHYTVVGSGSGSGSSSINSSVVGVEAEEVVILSEEALPVGLRSGDRIRLTLPENSMKKNKKLLTKLQSQGIQVELVTPPSTAAPRIVAAENLGPVELFKKYAGMRGLKPDAVYKGVDLLQNLTTNGDRSSGSTSSSMLSSSLSQEVNLCFESVEVEGYFSFKNAVQYDLSNRGLVVVTGKVEGGSEVAGGVDSNGAGKTALVMAPLWCVTGQVDARSEIGAGRGLTNADVVNDDSKLARVTLHGTVNGTPFTIQRTAARRGGRGSSLSFQLAGEDRTKQEMKLTQNEIDSVLGAGLLGRTVFYGQNEVTALLEANDKAFKDELGKLVDLSIWEAAKEVSKHHLSTTRQQLTSVNTELSMLENYRQQFEMQLEESKAGAMDWDEEQSRRTEELVYKVHTVLTTLKQSSVELGSSLDVLLASSQNAAASSFSETTQTEQNGDDNNDAFSQEDEHSNLETDDSDSDTKQQKYTLDLEKQQKKLTKQRQLLLQAQQALGAAEADVVTRKRALNEYTQLSVATRAHTHSHHSNGGNTTTTTNNNNDSGGICDRCLQPIDMQTYTINCQRLESDLLKATTHFTTAKDTFLTLQKKVSQLEKKVDCIRSDQMEAMQRQFHQHRAAEARLAKEREAQEIVEDAINLAKNCLDNIDKQIQPLETCLDTLNTTTATSSSSANNTANPNRAVHIPTASSQTSNNNMNQNEIIDAIFDLITTINRHLETAQSVQRTVTYAQEERNPFEPEVSRLTALLNQQATALTTLQASQDALDKDIEDWKSVDEAFRPSGIVSFVLEGVLGTLQEATASHLTALAPGVSLELAPCRPSKSDPDAVIERVERLVKVYPPDGGAARQRSVRQLSGGERRRVALALALGFSQLAGRKGRLRSDLLVLDEVMQHLDEEGCNRLAGLLRGLDYGSVLVVAQAHSFMTQAFDSIDVVVKDGREGTSTVAIGAGTA